MFLPKFSHHVDYKTVTLKQRKKFRMKYKGLRTMTHQRRGPTLHVMMSRIQGNQGDWTVMTISLIYNFCSLSITDIAA